MPFYMCIQWNNLYKCSSTFQWHRSRRRTLTYFVWKFDGV